MAHTVDATPKGANSNSYVTVAEATSYFEGRLYSDAWDTASVEEKKQAVVMATARLEVENFDGLPTDDNQALKWPRLWIENEDGSFKDENVLPPMMKEATFETALWLLRGDDTDPTQPSGLEGFDLLSAAGTSMNPTKGYSAGTLPAAVVRLLSEFTGAGGVGTFRIERA